MKLSRSEMEARSELFDRFALKDQKNYYESAIDSSRRAARQVNRYRALFSLLTGIAAALAALLVNSDALEWFVSILAIAAVVLPAIGGAFSTLADLYQWDKLVTIYDTALYNMEEADALSPHPGIDKDDIYRASMKAFAEGTLQIMSDETAQWGQSVRPPKRLEAFIREQRERSHRTIDSVTGDLPVDNPIDIGKEDDEDKP